MKVHFRVLLATRNLPPLSTQKLSGASIAPRPRGKFSWVIVLYFARLSS